MTARFNFYDFVAYLIPGFAALLLTFGFVGDHLPLDYFKELSERQFLLSVTLFVASYVIGHLVNALRPQLRRLKSWAAVAEEIRKGRIISTTVGVLLAYFRPAKIANVAQTHFYSRAILSPDGCDGSLKYSRDQRIPEPQLRRIHDALGAVFGIPMRTSADYQAAWTAARSWIGTRQAGGAAELYNSLSAMFRNLAIVLCGAFWLALLDALLDLWAGNLRMRDLCWSQLSLGRVASIFGPFVIAVVLVRMSRLLANQYEMLERLFAKEVVLAFQSTSDSQAPRP